MNKNIRTDIKKATLLSLKKLMRNQDIVKAQMEESSLGYGKCKMNKEGLSNLQYMDYVYQAARDIIEFDGSIEEWESRIEKM